MVDLVIRGDTVITPLGVGAHDILIANGAIAAITARGALPIPEGARLIDATGKIVMPGGIDPHVHCKWHLPNPDGSAGLTEPPDVVSKAAVHGGTTTMIDFTRASMGTNVRDAIEKREEDWKGHCACDYAQHIMVEGALPIDLPGQIAEAIQAGFPTVKIFTTDITPSRKGRMVDFGDIWEIFQVLAANKGLGVIHSEDNDIVMHMYAKLIREGRTGFEHLAEVHNTLSEDVSFRRVIRLAEKVPGTALYMMHVSAGTGVQAIRDARARNVPIYGESLHQYMLYTSEDYKKPNGQIYHTYPSLKSPEDQAELWAGTRDGAINCVATDEICCTLAKKLQGSRIDDTTGGNAGVEPRVGADVHGNGGHGAAIRCRSSSTSSRPTRRGSWGCIRARARWRRGRNADITVLDPADKRVITASQLHEADYTPWEGRKMEAWPCLTVLRGKVVVEDGVFKGSLDDGKWQHRKVADEMFTGARL